jgi:hypothetical protein
LTSVCHSFHDTSSWLRVPSIDCVGIVSAAILKRADKLKAGSDIQRLQALEHPILRGISGWQISSASFPPLSEGMFVPQA